jgi:hypothetical protein
MKTSISILWFVLLGASFSAAEYRIKTVDVLPIETYPARITLEGVTIAADPYDTNEKSFSAFDVKKMNTQGYFPLRVIIKNDTKSFLKIRTLNVTLITASGQQLYSTPSTVVVNDVIGSGLTSRIPIVGSSDPTTSTKAGSPLSDFAGKELTNRFLDPGTVSNGFLFFFTPDSKKNLFAGSTLYIPKLEEEGTNKALGPFFIPLDPALSQSE